MKRTKHIDLEMMRKSPGKRAVVRPLVLAMAAATLAACSSKEEVQVVTSVDDCRANTPLSLEQCETAYKKAQAEADLTGPKYRDMRTCETEFGTNQCHRSSSGIFMPMMTGFMVSQMLSNSGSSYNPVYRYNNRSSSSYNRLMTADGSVIGKPGQRSYSVNSSALKAKPASSWGGGRSSGGWGG